MASESRSNTVEGVLYASRTLHEGVARPLRPRHGGVPKGYTPTAAARCAGENTAVAMKSVVVDSSAYDWEGDLPLRLPSRGQWFTRCT